MSPATIYYRVLVLAVGTGGMSLFLDISQDQKKRFVLPGWVFEVLIEWNAVGESSLT